MEDQGTGPLCMVSGSMLGILYTFWGMGFLIFMKKGSFFLPGVMWAKVSATWSRRGIA